MYGDASSGLKFSDSVLFPTNGNGNLVNTGQDLGSSTRRFNRAFFAGTIDCAGITVNGNPIDGGGGGDDSRITDEQISNWDEAYLWGDHKLYGYATEDWVTNKKYATETWVTNKQYATQVWVTSQSYATQSWVNTQGYATQAWVSAGFSTIGTSYTKTESDGRYELKGGNPGGHNGTDAIQIAHKGISLGKDQQGTSFKSHPVIEMQSSSGINGGLNEHTGYRLSVGMTGVRGDQRFMFNCGSTWNTYNSTPALTIANAGCTASDFISTSDERLKDNITTVTVGLVDSLIGREWEWKESGKELSGVVAQEIEKVLPHVVSEDPEGTKAVSYSQLTAYLIEEIKDCRRRIAELENV